MYVSHLPSSAGSAALAPFRLPSQAAMRVTLSPGRSNIQAPAATYGSATELIKVIDGSAFPRFILFPIWVRRG